MKLKSTIFMLLLLLGAFHIQAQVVINELSAANWQGGFADNYGEFEDWIELYNTSGADFDLSGYWLSDDDTEPMKWEFPAGSVIPANDYLIVFASDRNEVVGGNYHTSFKITQGRQEGAVLADPGGTIVDSYMLDVANQLDHSRGRASDGDPNWSVFLNPTPGAANANPYQEYTTVSINTDAGNYSGTVNVDISSDDPDATIYYTLDGTTPTESSNPYTGPISLSNTTVVRARSFNPDPLIPPSFIETNTYILNEFHSIPVISVSGDELPTLLGGNQIEPIGHLELLAADGTLLAEASGDYNEHGNDSWAYDQRGIDYITQDEFGYGNELHYPIFRTKDREGYQRLIIKAAASDNYPFENGGAHIRDAYVQSLSQVADLRVDERSYEPCVMYVNGEYWGVYEIREKVDDLDFTDYYYDQGAGDVEFLKTWGGTWEEYGTIDEWNDLRDFILTNDMTDPANFDYVKGLYNRGSLIDYFTLNSYIVCADWLNWNTGWWRGLNPDGEKKKWRYILWDMDASFGHYINFTGVPDQSANADLCDPEQLGDPGGQGHVPIWNTLLENESFFADYINRFSDLSGSYFTCEFMHAHLDSLVGLIAPEMPRHIDRWGGTMAEWESNVQDIHDFIDTRCATVNDGVLDCYDELDGPYEITLMANPPEGGRIDLPTFEISEYPFTTTYFGGIDVPFDADENVGYVFSHWTANNQVITPDELQEEIVMNFTANDTLTAHFVAEEFFELTLDVSPAGSGTITYNGTVYSNFPVTIEVAGSTMGEATADPINGWDLDSWSATFPLNSSPLDNPATFTVEDNGTITANFFEIIYDVSFDVSPDDVATIDVDGEELSEYPQTMSLPGNVPIDIRTKPVDEFFEFSHWTTLSGIPIPDDVTDNIEITFNGPDNVVAHYVELPNFPLTIDAEPRGAGWVRIPDSLIQQFPYQNQQIGDDNFSLQAIERGKYEFSHWEVIFGVPMDYPERLNQSYFFGGPTHIVAHFEERLHDVFIPNSFSPNGDGVNDLLKVYANEIDLEDFKFTVSNRWGSELFSTTDINKGWDGSDEGGDHFVPPGQYTYFIRYVNTVTGEIVETAGTVTVIR